MPERPEAAIPVDPREVELLLLDVAGTLIAGGDAITDVQDRSELIAAAYGYPESIVSFFPTAMYVAVEPDGHVRHGRPPSLPDARLDQSAAVIALTDEIVGGGLAPGEARARLRDIAARPQRFGTPARVGGHILMTVGLALILQPTWSVLPAAIYFGALVGLMKIAADNLGVRVGFLLPVVAAAIVSAMAFLFLGQDSVEQPIRALVPPLITFLPGGLLTMALFDLASGEVITGASRFVAGLLQLLMLGLGIVIGAQLAGLPPEASLTDAVVNTIGTWAPWAGILVFGLGTAVFYSAPSGSLVWLLVVLYSAWAGQLAGNLVLTPELSGFVGGLVAFPIAVALQQFKQAPPAFVTFLPAFWLLVPGALGLLGVTQIVGGGRVAGGQDFSAAIVSVGAISLGVLAGATLVQWVRLRRGREVVTGLDAGRIEERLR